MLILLGLIVGTLACVLLLGLLPEPAHSHHCRTPDEDDEQAAILSGRARLEPQEHAAVHRGGL